MTIRSLATTASAIALCLFGAANPASAGRRRAKRPCRSRSPRRRAARPISPASATGSIPRRSAGEPARQGRAGGFLDLWLRQLRQHAAPCHRALRQIQGPRPGGGRRPHAGISVRAIRIQCAGRAEAAWHHLSGRAGQRRRRPGTPMATSTGRRNTSSTRMARSCSSMTAKASMNRSIAPSRACSRLPVDRRRELAGTLVDRRVVGSASQ